MHPRCRSTISAVISEGTRVARSKGGRNIRVPADMKYADYKAVYVDKTVTLKDWQNRRDGDKIAPRGLAAGKSLDTRVKGTSPKLIGTIDVTNPTVVQQTIEYFESRIVDAPIENGVVITPGGEVYHCTGDLNTLETVEELGDKLIGATVTHNHPVGSVNEYSFSDVDIKLFQKYRLERLRGIDEKYVYELNRNVGEVDFSVTNIGELAELNRGIIKDAHKRVGLLAITRGFGYRRWHRE